MEFIETSIFMHQIYRLLSPEEFRALQAFLVEHPDAGQLIVGSGGLRKLRWAASGRGKRGGIRTIYYWVVPHNVYLLFAYAKNKQENLTPQQISILRDLIKKELA